MLNSNLQIWQGRTGYQIMVDRWCRSRSNPIIQSHQKLKDWEDREPDWRPNSDGIYENITRYGGDLRGIANNLDYFVDLNINLLYLTPVSKSWSYHGYDVIDYDEIDPGFGTWEDYSYLCKKAKEKGILIVQDIVLNHTSIHSIYTKDPKYASWYKRDENGNYVFWWGFKDMPECDTMNKSYIEAATEFVMRFLEHGADGLRFDLGENLPREFMWAIATKVKKKYPTCIFIGEMWDVATRKMDPKITNWQFDSVMNYPLSDSNLRWVRYRDANRFWNIFYEIYNNYPVDVRNVLFNNIGTHDTVTTMSMFGDNIIDPNASTLWDIEGPWRGPNGSFNTYAFREYEANHDSLSYEQYELAKKRTKIAIAIMYILPGIPCIFQGTEIGETGLKDPFNRKPFNWKHQDEELKACIRELGRVRSENIDILAEGEAKIVFIDESILIFERFTNDKRLVLAANITDETKQIYIPSYRNNLKAILSHRGATDEMLMPHSFIIVRED